MELIRKININITDRIHSDTIFGTLFTIMLLYFFNYPRSIHPNNNYLIFTIVCLIVIIINIVNDTLKKQSKYALLDNLLFIGVLVYFAVAFISGQNAIYAFQNEETYVIHPGNFPRLHIRHLSGNVQPVYNLTFWSILVYAFFTLYGFFSRYRSNYKTHKNRVTLGNVLTNKTASTTLSNRIESNNTNYETEINMDVDIINETTEEIFQSDKDPFDDIERKK